MRKEYLGTSETIFLKKYRNHVRDTKYEKYYNSTELSEYVGDLKKSETNTDN